MEKVINIDGIIASNEIEASIISEGIEYYTSDRFVEESKELNNGDTLTINLDTYGGGINAGIKIYTICKELQSKGISVITFNKGRQHSIGNIVMLGGMPRKAYSSSIGVVHMPRVPSEYFTSKSEYTADDLEYMFSDLRLEENRILDIYTLETGTDKEKLRSIMNQERTLSAQELKELGFITEIVDGAPQVTTQNKKAFAYVNLVKPKNQKVENQLNEIQEKVGSLETLFKNFVNYFKKTSTVNMDFTSTDGKKLHVVREEGDMAVGDEATIDDMPDGEITLDDGTYVKVEAGKITEISKEQEDSEEVTNLKNQIAEKDAEIANLNAQLEATNATVNQMRDEVSTINATFVELKNAVTSYVPQGRTTQTTKDKPEKVGSVDLTRVKEIRTKK